MEELNYNLDQEVRHRTPHKNFDELYGTYHNLVHSIAKHYLRKHPADIEDLVSDVFVKVMVNLNQFSPQTNFKAWISRITVNTSFNYLRRKDNQTIELPFKVSEKVCLEEKLIDDLSTEKIMGYLKKRLPAEFYQSLELFYNGYDYPSIAYKLKIPIGTVMSRLFRGRKIAKSILDKERVLESKT